LAARTILYAQFTKPNNVIAFCVICRSPPRLITAQCSIIINANALITDTNRTVKVRYVYLAIVIAFLVGAGTLGVIYVGRVVVGIIGFAGIGGLVAWLLTTFKKPANPETIAPWYFLTLAALMAHITEEYVE